MRWRPGTVTVLIPLPTHYNRDRRGRRRTIERRKFDRTGDEVARLFGGGTLSRFPPGSYRGFWWDRGIVHRDVLALLEVDIPNTRGERARIVSYARRVLCPRFRQLAMYLRFIGPVDALTVGPNIRVER